MRVLLDHGAVTLATGGFPGRVLTFERGTRCRPDAELVLRLPDNYFKAV